MQSGQNNAFPIKSTLNCRGRLVDISSPLVMGILNVTPDSFHDGGKYNQMDQLLIQAERHLNDGATFLDIGAVSTRPKAADVSEESEFKRLIPAVEVLHSKFPEAILSVDTYRSNIAKQAVASGADIINDISGGTFDQAMFETVAQLNVPYVIMHMQGTPQTMQDNPSYENVVLEVFEWLLSRVIKLRQLGVHDVVIDPGFGFGKSVEHNFQLLRSLDNFNTMGCPILAGLSRKSMINKTLEIKSAEALNGTTALNMVALQNGAKILRVHDVKEASECTKLFNSYERL